MPKILKRRRERGVRRARWQVVGPELHPKIVQTRPAVLGPLSKASALPTLLGSACRYPQQPMTLVTECIAFCKSDESQLFLLPAVSAPTTKAAAAWHCVPLPAGMGKELGRRP